MTTTSLPSVTRIAEAVAADCGSHCSHDANRREPHDVPGDHEHHLGESVQPAKDRGALVADDGECDAEEGREHDDLQDVAFRHGVHDGGRHGVQQDVPGALLPVGHRGELAGVGSRS